MVGTFNVNQVVRDFWWAERVENNAKKVRCRLCHADSTKADAMVNATRDTATTHQEGNTHKKKLKHFVVQLQGAPDGEEDPIIAAVPDEPGTGFCRIDPDTGRCVVDTSRKRLPEGSCFREGIEVVYVGRTYYCVFLWNAYKLLFY